MTRSTAAKTARLCVAGIAAVLCAAGWAAATAPARAASPEAMEGLAIARKHCARCHAVGVTGASPHAEAPPFREFAAKWPLENLEEALADGIVTGHQDMPAFVFEPPEIAALIAHLEEVGKAGRKTPK